MVQHQHLVRKNNDANKKGEEVFKGAPPGFVDPTLKGAPLGFSGARAKATASKVKATATSKKSPGLKRLAAAEPSAAPAAAAASQSDAAPPVDNSWRRKRIKIPSEAVGRVGCSKCRHNKDVGCTTCRPKLGLIDMGHGKWDWPSAS